jgi:MarR family transcriptional regulator, temperature-dependent positive regulator of motility
MTMNTPSPNPAFSGAKDTYRLEKSLTHLLHRVGQCATDAFQRYAGDQQITARQFAVLMAIDRMDGASQMDVVKMTGIDRSTLADMVGRMLGKGLIERERSKLDGRAYSLSLTEMGKTALQRSLPAASRADELLMTSLDLEQREQLLSALDKVLHALGTSSGEGEPTTGV